MKYLQKSPPTARQFIVSMQTFPGSLQRLLNAAPSPSLWPGSPFPGNPLWHRGPSPDFPPAPEPVLPLALTLLPAYNFLLQLLSVTQ